jgi:hypothetical protein
VESRDLPDLEALSRVSEKVNEHSEDVHHPNLAVRGDSQEHILSGEDLRAGRLELQTEQTAGHKLYTSS